MSKHTPGPWTAHQPDRWRTTSIRAEGQNAHRSTVANVRPYGVVTGESEEGRANAHLIAAAPELLEALEQIAEYDVDDAFGYLNEWTEAAAFSACQKIARAAIAKAEEGA